MDLLVLILHINYLLKKLYNFSKFLLWFLCIFFIYLGFPYEFYLISIQFIFNIIIFYYFKKNGSNWLTQPHNQFKIIWFDGCIIIIIRDIVLEKN